MGGREPRRGDAELTAGQARAVSPRHWAEELAERALVSKGYLTLERNYRLRGGEIDLVMQAPDGTVVFVEVRQRRSDWYGGAGGSISADKQRRLRRTAAHYLATVLRDPEAEARCDAVLVSGVGQQAHLTHLEDAF